MRVILGIVLCVLAGLSTVIAVGIGLHDWSTGMDFAVAAWGAFKFWVGFSLLAIPGAILVFSGITKR